MGLLLLLHAACTLWVIQYRHTLANLSSPAQPGAVAGSEVHSKSLSMAPEAWAESLQLSHCWKCFAAFGRERCFTRGEHIARLFTLLNFKHLI